MGCYREASDMKQRTVKGIMAVNIIPVQLREVAVPK